MAELHVELFSHHFACTQLTSRARAVVGKFAWRYVPEKWEKIPGTNRFRKVPDKDKAYLVVTEDREEFRFHINLLKEFQEHLQLNFLKDDLVKWESAALLPTPDVYMSIKPEWVSRDYQIPVIAYLTSPDSPRSKFVNLQTGKGKAQPLDAQLKVPGGWMRMGDVQVGSKVIAKDGSTTSVLAVHPQGVKDIYRVTFYDGRSTECCGDHLWRVFRSSSPSYWKTVTTLELIEMLTHRPDRCFINLAIPQDGPELDLPIAPYTLGAILGDAHFGETTLFITTPDEFIIDELRKELPCDMRLDTWAYLNYGFVRSETSGKENVYQGILRSLGLAKKLSYDKFIPEQYFHGSRQQRLSLLQGLMDTDGTVNTSGSLSFCSTSPALAKGVVYLARSLGAIASISEKLKYFTYAGERKLGRLAYQVNIRHSLPTEFFRLPKKKNRINDLNQYSPTLKLRIESIELICQKEAQCITIAHPDHLYVTDEFIVTHNSYCTMKAQTEKHGIAVMVIRPMFIAKWLIDLRNTFNLDIDDIIVAQGADELMGLLELAATELTPSYKWVIISNKTAQNWLTLYQLKREETLELGYACLPHQLFQHLKARTRVIDEVHLDFLMNFRLDCITHVEDSVSLSATLIPDDDFKKKMVNIAYPNGDRYEGMPYDKYITGRAVFYSFRDPSKIRMTNRGSNRYSHNAFEQSIMKNAQATENYMQMLDMLMRGTYLRDDFYRSGDKCILFFASVDMCTHATTWFKRRYPDKTVMRYVEEDPYEYLMEPDIRCTTLMSAGTAVDIPGLTTTILTPAVKSSQSNVQGLGRLRKLPDGRAPILVWLICQDFPKHIEYHEHRKKLLEPLMIGYRSDQVGILV